MSIPPSNWLGWARRLHSIAQAGLTYTQNPFDIERYHQIQTIAAELLAAGAQVPQPTVQAVLDAQSGYATPKLDVRGAVFQDGKVLLVKEHADGRWTLPGGWIDLGESPRQAVEREVWEESGYRVRAEKLLALQDRTQHGYPPSFFHTYKLIFRCALLGGEASTSIETDGAQFFAEDDIPPLSLARTTPEVLQRLFEHLRHPEWPTDFD